MTLIDAKFDAALINTS